MDVGESIRQVRPLIGAKGLYMEWYKKAGIWGDLTLALWTLGPSRFPSSRPLREFGSGMRIALASLRRKELKCKSAPFKCPQSFPTLRRVQPFLDKIKKYEGLR
jgi:hypothetical protein